MKLFHLWQIVILLIVRSRLINNPSFYIFTRNKLPRGRAIGVLNGVCSANIFVSDPKGRGIKPHLIKHAIYLIKKYFSLLIFLILIATVSVAQEFHGGVMAGLAGSQVAGDNYSGFKKAGIFVGGYVNLDIGSVSALQFELTYFQKGSRENPTEKNGYQSYLVRLNYIEMPVLYQYKAGRFIIEAGPSLGFLMGYHEEKDQEIISDQPYYIKPARVTFQINIGLGVFISPNFYAGLRSNNSLINIYSENQTGDIRRIFDYGRYNDSLVLFLSYRFNSKKEN